MADENVDYKKVRWDIVNYLQDAAKAVRDAQRNLEQDGHDDAAEEARSLAAKINRIINRDAALLFVAIREATA